MKAYSEAGLALLNVQCETMWWWNITAKCLTTEAQSQIKQRNSYHTKSGYSNT